MALARGAPAATRRGLSVGCWAFGARQSMPSWAGPGCRLRQSLLDPCCMGIVERRPAGADPKAGAARREALTAPVRLHHGASAGSDRAPTPSGPGRARACASVRSPSCVYHPVKHHIGITRRHEESRSARDCGCGRRGRKAAACISDKKAWPNSGRSWL